MQLFSYIMQLKYLRRYDTFIISDMNRQCASQALRAIAMVTTHSCGKCDAYTSCTSKYSRYVHINGVGVSGCGKWKLGVQMWKVEIKG